jgi:hypothetical protein
MHNAYVACASTGKAAVSFGGVTVQAAFRLNISRKTHQLSREVLQTYRHLLRNVKCVIIDDVSMCSSHLFNAVNSRLQAMTGVYNTNFGGLDLKQLPLVSAAPVYCATQRSIGGGALPWQSLNYYPLVRVVSQSDTRFAIMFTRMGCGERLTADETDMIKSRFRTRELCDANLPGVVRRLYLTTRM